MKRSLATASLMTMHACVENALSFFMVDVVSPMVACGQVEGYLHDIALFCSVGK